jgi:hypothetical protein
MPLNASPSLAIDGWRRAPSRRGRWGGIAVYPSSFQSLSGVLEMLMKIMFITVFGGLS